MVEQDLLDLFPRLRGRSFRITSSHDPAYNCIAFAAGDMKTWWWPDEAEEDTWPADVVRAETIEGFRDAFRTLGYVECSDDRPEPGFERVAFFAVEGQPKHVAKQLPNGRWTSKLGQLEDIEHELEDLTGELYGSVVLIMKRSVSVA